MQYNFKEEDVLYLKEIKLTNRITTEQVKRVESIWRSIDPKYRLCNTCRDVISAEINRIFKLVESTIGMPLAEFEGYEKEEVAPTQEELNAKFLAMTAQQILDFMSEEYSYDVDLPKNKKKQIIEKSIKYIIND